MRLALAGATGFIGRAIGAEGRSSGLDVTPIHSPRLAASGLAEVQAVLRGWFADNGRTYANLVSQLEGADVLVNAAGMAAPDSCERELLFGANMALPVLLARAAADAGVGRMVHISSASVQGRREPLDETSRVCPLTPYAESKADGERALVEQHGGPYLTIYRPTSVQGVDRALTRSLVRLASLPVVPACFGGLAPLPVSLIENVAAGVVHVCQSSKAPEIVLQPWETMTTRRLVAAFGTARIMSLPTWVARRGLGFIYLFGHKGPTVGIARRLELFVLGQSQDAKTLLASGFIPPAGPDAYERLAHEVRQDVAST